MKSVKEFRQTVPFKPHEINSSIKYFDEKAKIDYDVYLPSLEMNLQREFLWTLQQKSELILSILMGRHIPRMAMVCTYDLTYQIIDGKQRLSTMINFYRNKEFVVIDDVAYYFKELPDEHQLVIANYHFPYYLVHENRENEITDADKIQWFKFINFAGTLQEIQHFNNLTKNQKS